MSWRDGIDRALLPDGWRQMPVQRAERPAAPRTATRRDGTTVDIRRSLGLPSVPPPDDDAGVKWENAAPWH